MRFRRMAARYLVRFDDIAPGMNWRIWNEVERILNARSIRPILAVVPDNRDPDLDVEARNSEFWDRVRSWQAQGWTIGLHGHQHRYETSEPGIVGLNRNSEFAGLPESVQSEKLRAAMAILEREGVRPDTWIAPAHSFDEKTVRLLLGMGVPRLSDGYFLEPGVDRYGMLWVPQQLWRFRRRRRGLWTVCYHVNHWGDEDLSRFTKDLDAFGPDISDWDSVCAVGAARKLTVADSMFAFGYRHYLHLLRRASAVKRRLTKTV